MKTVTIELFDVMELKEKYPDGYQFAYRQFQEKESSKEYDWTDEVTKTMKRFLAMFDCDWVSWSVYDYVRYDYRMPQVSFENDGDEMVCLDFNNITGEWLSRYFEEHISKDDLKAIRNYESCPLTGVCFDYEPLHVICEYLEEGKYQDYSLEELIDLGLSKLVDEVESDIEYHESEEGFIEHCREFDCHFTKEGQLFQ